MQLMIAQESGDPLALLIHLLVAQRLLTGAAVIFWIVHTDRRGTACYRNGVKHRADRGNGILLLILLHTEDNGTATDAAIAYWPNC